MIKTNLNKVASGNLDLGTGTVIDCYKSNFFFNNISANKTFSLVNIDNGHTIILVVRNTGTSTINLTFPAGIKKVDSFVNAVEAGKSNVYTIIKSDNAILINSISGLA